MQNLMNYKIQINFPKDPNFNKHKNCGIRVNC